MRLKPVPEPSDSKLPIALVCLAAVLPYINALPGILFWDSEVLILNNVFLRSFSFLPEIWSTPVMAGGGEISNYYRPVPVTLFMLQYQLWGASPFGYHAVVILCHAAAAILLYHVLKALARDPAAALWAAALFALHPIQNETVNYVDHVEGIQAFAWGLLALLLHVRGKRPWSLLCWALSLLSKEEAVVLFPVMALFEWYRPREEKEPPPALRGLLERLWAHGTVLAVYLVLHVTVFNFLKLPLHQYGAQQGSFASLPLRLLTFAKALLVYLRLLVLPTGLHFDRDMAPAAFGDPWAWAAAAACAAVLGALWRLSRDEPAAKAGLLWFLAALLPYCGLVPFNNILAEHFLYIPSAGLLLTAVVLARRASGFLAPGAGVTLMLPVLVFYGWQNLSRNRDWQDASRIYASTLKGNPGSFRAANNLGVEHFRAGRHDEALRSFELALRANRLYPPALNNVGAIAEQRGRFNEAMAWYQRSASANPGYALAQKNIASLFLLAKRYPEAEAASRLALKAHPGYAEAWMLLGAACFHQGRAGEARDAFETAARLQPSPTAFNNLALVYDALGDPVRAREARLNAVR